MATFAEKDPHMREFFCISICAGQRSVVLVNGGQFPQTILHTAQRGFVATLDITKKSVFEVHMHFDSIGTVVNTIQVKSLKCFCS